MASQPRARALRGRVLVILAATAVLALAAGPAVGKKAPPGPGFLTSQASMLTGVAGSSVMPIITVGDMVGGFRFEAIPDGISIRPHGKGTVDLYVNHETSTVPFPYNPTAPTELNSQNDFDNAQVSKLRLSQKSMGVLKGSYVVESDENFQRLCSNFLATKENGFKEPLLLTNEEAIDWVNREGKAWPATIGAAEARQSGVVVAHDIRSGKSRPIWGMGRHNHENSVAIPGYGKPVVLSGDDTFTNNPSQSQLYSYIADSSKAVWNDEGALWAFVSDDPLRQKYEDFVPGDATSITGHFIPVPRNIATGMNPDGSEIMSSDVGFPPPPNTSAWQRDQNGIGIDGPQWVLDYWSQTNGVFNFVRLEDIAYDKRPGMSNVVYVVDSGRGTAGAPVAGRSTNGRIWELVLDPADPTQVDSMRILIEGDDNAVKHPGEIHQPDNIESTPNGLYIQEDPGSSQQFPFGSIDPASSNFDANATNARIWQYRFATNTMSVAAVVDQSADEGPTDVDATTAPGNHGAWESSGIVDASAVFGPGAFLVTIQASSLWVEKAPGDDNFAPPGPDFTFKRNGGQLVLLRIPGG